MGFELASAALMPLAPPPVQAPCDAGGQAPIFHSAWNMKQQQTRGAQQCAQLYTRGHRGSVSTPGARRASFFFLPLPTRNCFCPHLTKQFGVPSCCI